MAKRVLRRIVVDGESYLWSCGHSHLKHYERSPCVETLTVFPQYSKRNHLRIRFKEEDNNHATGKTNPWHTGYPQSGVLWRLLRDPIPGRTTVPSVQFNLNRPKVAAALIRLLRETRWNPTESKAPLHIENGLILLDEHLQALLDMIDPSGITTESNRDTGGFPTAHM